MKQVVNLQKLKNLSYFSLDTLSQVVQIKKESLYKIIFRWIKQEKLIQLKKGLYTTSSYLQQVRNKTSYLEFISNKLRYPSYLSLEYVLTKHQVLTESVFTYTSATTKVTRSYGNSLGKFSYRTISDNLFTGFNFKMVNGFQVAEATKAKALFDYLYFKLYRQHTFTSEMIEDLRLNLDEFTKKEIKEFDSYCNLVGIKKYKILTNLLFGEIKYDN